MLEQFYMFMWFSMLVEGSELDIELHKNILNYGKNSLASLVQRRDQCLKLISSSTTYRNTCLLGQERAVGGSLL